MVGRPEIFAGRFRPLRFLVWRGPDSQLSVRGSPMCDIDWRLVLEYVKVLVAPIAAVVGAVLVSRLGLDAFRRQKAFEFRVAWYAEAYRLLDRAAKAIMAATFYSDQSGGEGRARFDRALEASTDLGDHLAQSFVYADQDAHQAVADLGQALQTILQRIETSKRISVQDGEDYGNACLLTSLKIAAGLRRDMRQAALRPPS
jgi:hypothetical protein